MVLTQGLIGLCTPRQLHAEGSLAGALLCALGDGEHLLSKRPCTLSIGHKTCARCDLAAATPAAVLDMPATGSLAAGPDAGLAR